MKLSLPHIRATVFERIADDVFTAEMDNDGVIRIGSHLIELQLGDDKLVALFLRDDFELRFSYEATVDVVARGILDRIELPEAFNSFRST